MSEYCIVLITTSNESEAQKIAEGLVNERLAACVNIVPQIRSIYRWQGEIQHDTECLLICKTMPPAWSALQEWATRHHSYEVPEIIQIPIVEGASPYLQWIISCLEK